MLLPQCRSMLFEGCLGLVWRLRSIWFAAVPYVIAVSQANLRQRFVDEVANGCSTMVVVSTSALVGAEFAFGCRRVGVAACVYVRVSPYVFRFSFCAWLLLNTGPWAVRSSQQCYDCLLVSLLVFGTDMHCVHQRHCLLWMHELTDLISLLYQHGQSALLGGARVQPAMVLWW